MNEDDFVRARLTALAIETKNFSRDDIYTLFVTTRILNFLKGLPLAASASVADLMNHAWPDYRTRVGFELLNLLARTGHLHFWTKSGVVQNGRFRTELFLRVLSDAQAITCQNGQTIDIKSFDRPLTDFDGQCSTDLDDRFSISM